MATLNLKKTTQVLKVTAVAVPQPDGAKITKAIISFADTPTQVENITVKDRNIVGRSVDNNVVTLFLDEEDTAAQVFPQGEDFGKGPGPVPGVEGSGNPREEPRKVPRIAPRFVQPVKVTVNIPGVGEVESDTADLGVMSEFVPGKLGKIPYSLYSPKDPEPGVLYPVVMFIPDASVNGDNYMAALVQGIGAVIWAMPEEQAKRPCYVLAIQVPKDVPLTGGGAALDPEIYTIKKILDKVIAENPIDPARVYTTGQSQGCMASCALNILYPDFFAASLLVAGQWDDPKMGTLKDHKFFIGLSAGGPREFPGMNIITADLEANGAKLARIALNYRDGIQENDRIIREQVGDANVVYCVYDKDTIFPDDGKVRAPIMHHNRGWELCYQLEAAREWIFSQHK